MANMFCGIYEHQLDDKGRLRIPAKIKKFLAAVTAGNKEEATKLYPETVSAIDSAASKGILHKNNAANKKAKLAKKLNAMEA